MRGLRSRKLAAILIFAVIVIVVLLPNIHTSRDISNTFIISHMKYSGLNINRFENRMDHLIKYCSTVNQSDVGYPKTLLYSKGLNTVYCPVPHVFSTWFKHAMLQVESKPLTLQQRYNVSTLQAIHSEALTLNLKRSVLLKPESLSQGPQHTLIFVRDPWQRLLAAYSDIVVRQHSYKTKCAQFKDTFSRELKFDGFLRCLIHYANGSHSLHKLDLKLSPIHTICSVCRVPYTIIGRYESLSADLYDYLSTIRAEAKEKLLDLYQQATIPANFPLQMVQSYMDSVDRKVIQDIQQIYALDFKLFGYVFK